MKTFPLPDPLKLAQKKSCRKTQHRVDHGGSKCGSENKRTACAFASRVTAPSVLSMLHTRTCHPSEPRVAISLLMLFSTMIICTRRHECQVDMINSAITVRVLRLTERIDTTFHTSSRRKKSRRHSSLRVGRLVLASSPADWPRMRPIDFLP